MVKASGILPVLRIIRNRLMHHSHILNADKKDATLLAFYKFPAIPGDVATLYGKLLGGNCAPKMTLAKPNVRSFNHLGL